MMNTKVKSNVNEATISESERRLVAKAMNDAGYNNVDPSMVEKVANKYNFDVYCAVIGDAMVLYTPQWKHNIKFICF